MPPKQSISYLPEGFFVKAYSSLVALKRRRGVQTNLLSCSKKYEKILVPIFLGTLLRHKVPKNQLYEVISWSILIST